MDIFVTPENNDARRYEIGTAIAEKNKYPFGISNLPSFSLEISQSKRGTTDAIASNITFVKVNEKTFEGIKKNGKKATTKSITHVEIVLSTERELVETLVVFIFSILIN